MCCILQVFPAKFHTALYVWTIDPHDRKLYEGSELRVAVPGCFVCRCLLKPSPRCEMDYINTDNTDKRLVIKKNSALCFVFNLVMINALMLTAIIIIHFNCLSKRHKWLIPISFSPTRFFFFFFFYWLLCYCWRLIILNSAVMHGHSFIFKPTYEPAWIRSLWRQFCLYLSTLLTLASCYGQWNTKDSFEPELNRGLTGSTSCHTSSVLL